MRRTPLLLSVALAAASITHGPTSAQVPSVTAQIERYMRGEHAAVIAELKALKEYDPLLENLQRDAPGWIAAAPADAERAARRLAAATFALEAARAAHHVDWKWVRRLKAQGNAEGGDEPEGADRVFWKAPPLLIEWGCALMRTEPAPRSIERVWHLAAIAVAQRAGDFEFLIGSPWEERMNAADEIDHATHGGKRFPRESRFALAQAIAVEWRTWPARGGGRVRQQGDVIANLKRLVGDDAVGAEASMRLGTIYARIGQVNDALSAFAYAERRTRDRYVIYLARYFKGLMLDKNGRAPEAEAAYRAALAVIPQAQSATIALAALLTKQGKRVDAGTLIEAQLSTRPQPVDPWLTYAAADDRFWPELIAQLRAEIQR